MITPESLVRILVPLLVLSIVGQIFSFFFKTPKLKDIMGAISALLIVAMVGIGLYYFLSLYFGLMFDNSTGTFGRIVLVVVLVSFLYELIPPIYPTILMLWERFTDKIKRVFDV
jgi:hypothetical protein